MTPRSPGLQPNRRPEYAALKQLLLSGALLAGLIGVTVLAFSPSLGGGFLNWDDDRNFVENVSFRGLGWAQLRWAWSTYHLGVWQPLSWLLLGLQYELGGLDPTVYHATSLVLHVANVLLLYVLVLEVLRISLPAGAAVDPSTSARRGTSRPIPLQSERPVSPATLRLCAAAAVALFAVHPLRVEVVSWISCQPYLPAVFFCQLGVLLYLRGCRRPTSTCTGGCPAIHPRAATLIAVFACYVLAVMAKAVAVSLPVVLLILDVYPLRRFSCSPLRKFPCGGVEPDLDGEAVGRRTRTGLRMRAVIGHVLRAVVEKLPFFVVAAFVSIWAAHAKDFNESRVPFAESDGDARLAQTAYGLFFYLWKTVLPRDLIPYDRLPEGLSLFVWPYGACALAAILLAAAMIAYGRRWPWALATFAVYAVILLPNLGIVQISQQIAADRYAYLASIAPTALFAGLLCAIARRLRRGRDPSDAGDSPSAQSRRERERPTRAPQPAPHHRSASGLAIGCGCLVVAALVSLVALSRQQARLWQDSETLWRATLAVDPRCAVAECQLGHALAVEGRLDEAATRFARAVELQGDFAFAHGNLGTILLAQGKFAEAADRFQRAIAIQPGLGQGDIAKAHAGLGAACAGTGQFDLAWRHTLIARRLGFEPAENMIAYLREFAPQAEPNKP